VGTQREVVSREFARLAALGLIARTGRDLLITAVSALTAEIERQGGDPSLSE
ncbi:transcriptional regulator, partial [Pseudomonas sp. GW531-E2]